MHVGTILDMHQGLEPRDSFALRVESSRGTRSLDKRNVRVTIVILFHVRFTIELHLEVLIKLSK